MNDNNDKWLDDLLSKTVNTVKPQFDAEKFKQKFPDELQILQSRNSKQPQRLFSLRSIFNDPFSSFATAAVLILMVGIFVFFSVSKDDSIPHKKLISEKSHIELLTSTSLMNAYLEGGMEAVDEQNRKAAKMLNRKSEEITIHELLEENSNI